MARRHRHDHRSILLLLLLFLGLMAYGALFGQGEAGDGGLARTQAPAPSVSTQRYHLSSSVRAPSRKRMARYDTIGACGAFRARVGTADQMSLQDLVGWAQGMTQLGEHAPSVLKVALHRLVTHVAMMDPVDIDAQLFDDLGSLQTTCTRLAA